MLPAMSSTRVEPSIIDLNCYDVVSNLAGRAAPRAVQRGGAGVLHLEQDAGLVVRAASRAEHTLP
jgi:hypothetical protein